MPQAGVLAALWLSIGAIFYALHLGPRARVVDASSEGLDPQMMRLRGRRPVVLTPIANPASAEMLVTMAKALAPPDVSRVQLLSVVGLADQDPRDGLSRGIRDAQAVLGGALSTALDVDLRPEALITLHKDPWHEIARVAEASRCESLLLGVGHLDDSLMTGPARPAHRQGRRRCGDHACPPAMEARAGPPDPDTVKGRARPECRARAPPWEPGPNRAP